MSFNYGMWAAMKRKEKKKDEIANTTKKKKIKKLNKIVPSLNLTPLEGVVLDKKFINWENDTTKNNGVYLSDELKSMNFKLLQMPTGTGKTAVAISTLGEVNRRLNGNVTFIILASRAIVDDKGWAKTILEYNEYYTDNQIIPYTIDTYDRFANVIKDPRSFKKLLKDIGKNVYIVIDEVHNYKNPTSKRTKMMHKLSFAKKLGLSATPLTNNVVMDSGSYLIFADYFRNKTDFMDKTGLKLRQGEYGKLLIYNRHNRIDERFWPYYPQFKELMATVLYKPDVNIRDLDMPEITKHYVQIESNETLNGDIKSLAAAYNKRAFDSITDYLIEVQERIYTDEYRLDKLLKILENKELKQPLIYYYHVNVGDQIEKALLKKGIQTQRISGSHSVSDVDKSLDLPILIQYQSGREGIEFKDSNCTIFYQNQPSYTNLIQARGRNQRRGMDHDVEHYYMIAEIYFDQELFRRVENMEELNEEMILEILLESDK